MKYLMIDENGEVTVLGQEPTLEEVQDNNGAFLSLGIIREDDIQVRKAVITEPEEEGDEAELDWELLT